MVETRDSTTYTPTYWHLSITDEPIYVWDNSREWKVEGKPAEEWKIDKEEYVKYPICLRCGNDSIVIERERENEYVYANEKGEIVYTAGEGEVTDVYCEKCGASAVIVFWIRKRDAEHLRKMDREKRLKYILQCILRGKIAISRDTEDTDINMVWKNLPYVVGEVAEITVYDEVEKLARQAIRTLTQGAKL